MHWTSDFHCVCIDVPVCFSFCQQVCLLHLWYSISTFPKQENETVRQKEWEFLWKNKKKSLAIILSVNMHGNTHGPTSASAMTNTICTVLRCLSDLHSEYQFASMGKLYMLSFVCIHWLHPLAHSLTHTLVKFSVPIPPVVLSFCLMTWTWRSQTVSRALHNNYKMLKC